MKLRLTVILLLIMGVINAFIFRESVPLGKPIETANVQPLSPGAPSNPFLIGVMESYGALSNYDAADGLNITHQYIDTYWDSTLNRHAPYDSKTNREHLTAPVPTKIIQSTLQALYTPAIIIAGSFGRDLKSSGLLSVKVVFTKPFKMIRITGFMLSIL